MVLEPVAGLFQQSADAGFRFFALALVLRDQLHALVLHRVDLSSRAQVAFFAFLL